MKYKIEITRTEREEYEGHEWARTGNKNKEGGEEYAYTPMTTMTREVKRTILMQEVGAIDLNGIIKAINLI